MKDMLVGESIAGVKGAVSTLPRRLREVGLEVPTGLVEALEAARVRRDPDAAVKAAEDKRKAAKTQEQWEAATAELNAARAARYQDVGAGSFAAHRVGEVYQEVRAGMVRAVIEAFNASAVEFAEAVTDLPNMRDGSRDPLDLTDDQFARLRRARTLADRLSDLLDIYRDVEGSLGRDDLSTAITIGTYLDDDQWMRTADDIRRYKFGQGRLGKLAPFVCVLNQGGTLGLRPLDEVVAHRESIAVWRGVVDHGRDLIAGMSQADLARTSRPSVPVKSRR